MKSMKKCCLILISLCFLFPALVQAKCESGEYEITIDSLHDPDTVHILHKKTGEVFIYEVTLSNENEAGDFSFQTFLTDGSLWGFKHREVLRLYYYHEGGVLVGYFQEYEKGFWNDGVTYTPYYNKEGKIHELRDTGSEDPIHCDGSNW